MKAQLPLECSGELHWLTIEDDGTLTLDPEKHDVDLELSLSEMGAEPPLCIGLKKAWDLRVNRRTRRAIHVLAYHYSPKALIAGVAMLLQPEIDARTDFHYPNKAISEVRKLLSGETSPRDFAVAAFPSPTELSAVARVGNMTDKRLHEAAHHMVAAAMSMGSIPAHKKLEHPWDMQLGATYSHYINKSMMDVAIATGYPMPKVLQKLALATQQAAADMP